MATMSSKLRWLNRLDALFRQKKAALPAKPLQRFDQTRQSQQAYESVNRGVAQILLARIVGTVGRYQDFDSQFRPKANGVSDRYLAIRRAMAAGKSLPPVSLYQIKEDYFILDGHHRVTAARELGKTHIRACILELLPGADTLENKLYLERIEFRDRAGLAETIELTEPGQFDQLVQQVEFHQQFLDKGCTGGVSFQQAAADWHRTIYRPLRALVEGSGLVRSFPGRTVDDLYLYISVHQWQPGKTRKYGIGIDRLIPKDMEAFREKMAEYKEAEYPEMKREIIVFVLLNVDGRQEARIMDRLLELDEVDEVHSVHGSIDFVVKATLQRDLLASDAEVISQFTHGSIRTLRGVKSTQTLIPGISRVKGKKRSDRLDAISTRG